MERFMSLDSSRSSVVAALTGNTIVAIFKFVAFFVTGSGTMLSEAIHTVADVFNQVLLLVGIVRSQRDPDEDFEYGYGAERFVWALMSAVGIFFLGCGVTIYHGVSTLLHPHEVTGLGWAVGVLIGALLVEGYVLYIATMGLWRLRGEIPFWTYLRERADPSAVAVVLEDFAACLGCIIALTAIILVQVTGEIYWDGIGSIAIGILLGFVALWLIGRNRALLVGTAMPADARARVREVLRRHSAVERLVELKSKVIDTETYDVLLTIEFKGERFADRLRDDLEAAYPQINDVDEFIRQAGRFADKIIGLLGDEIDLIEAEIREAVPQVKIIDIEPN
jgi:zinc transporter 9